jgi:serine/threonine protein kinase
MPVKMLVDQFDIPGFATELLDGETLRQRLRRGPLRAERAIAIVLQVAKALDALHKAGAVHGDLRPENIFLVRPGPPSPAFAGKVVIVEHSLLSPAPTPGRARRSAPPIQADVSTRPSCSPVRRGRIAGGDVFVLGAILHECLTGRPAFFDEVADFVIDNLHQPPKPLVPNPQTGLVRKSCASHSTSWPSAPAPATPKSACLTWRRWCSRLEASRQEQGPQAARRTDRSRPNRSTPEIETKTEQRMHRLLERRSGVYSLCSVHRRVEPRQAKSAPSPSLQPAAPSSQPAAPSSQPSLLQPQPVCARQTPRSARAAASDHRAQKEGHPDPAEAVERVSGAHGVAGRHCAIEERTVQPARPPAHAQATRSCRPP